MTEHRTSPLISRRGILQGALALGAGMLAAPAVGIGAAAPAAAAGTLTVTRLKVLAGTQSPVQYGIGATDLGIPARTPDGRLLFVFGDTWADHVGGANWRSPVGLYSSTTNLAAGVVFSGSAGAGANTQGVAPQFWYYPHDAYFTTVIPSDVITIGSRMYLQAIVNGPQFGAVRWTELWKSDDNGATWQHWEQQRVPLRAVPRAGARVDEWSYAALRDRRERRREVDGSRGSHRC